MKESQNLKAFKALVKELPDEHRQRLPEKIRWVMNRQEHNDFLKAIVMGAYLALNDEITISGYVPGDLLLPDYEGKPYKTPDGSHATTIENNITGDKIIP